MRNYLKKSSSKHGLLDANSEFLDLMEKCRIELDLKNQVHENMWGLRNSDWQLDQDDGFLLFNSPKGYQVKTPAQIIGTYNLNDNSWLWAWANSSIEQKLLVAAQSAHEFGQNKNIQSLTTKKLYCSINDARGLAAIVCYLENAQGVYFGMAGTTAVCMTFGTVSISKNN